MKTLSLAWTFALVFAASGCGLDPLSVAKRTLGPEPEYRVGRECTQNYQEVGFLENHTAQTLNLTLSFPDYSSATTWGTVAAQIAPGGIWSQVLTSYQSLKYGEFDGNGNQSDAYCTPTPEKKLVDLSTLDGVATVRLCRVKTGVAYLFPANTACPDYTTE